MAHLCTALIQLVLLWNITRAFYFERRSQCLYSFRNLSDMVFLDSYIFNKVELVRFDSRLNKYVGYNELGFDMADYWNSVAEVIQQVRTYVDVVCRNNAAEYFTAIMDQTVEPKVNLRSLKEVSETQPAILLCSAYDFYPKTIRVSWLRDGKPVTSDVTSTEELADGDWYYQIHSHLEYTPRPGEKISCVVEHASFQKPMVYDLDPSLPESERNKIAIGASGLVLGIVLSAAGFIYYKKKSSRPY